MWVLFHIDGGKNAGREREYRWFSNAVAGDSLRAALLKWAAQTWVATRSENGLYRTRMDIDVELPESVRREMVIKYEGQRIEATKMLKRLRSKDDDVFLPELRDVRVVDDGAERGGDDLSLRAVRPSRRED